MSAAAHALQDEGPPSADFHGQLARSWAASGSMLCVGLDPLPDRIPAGFGSGSEAVLDYLGEIVDATADLVCAFKPQIAHFAALGAEDALAALCTRIRSEHPDVTLVLDAKRGDVGSTAERYAIEVFDRYHAHAVTVNPYLGTDAAAPFLARGGVIALCRTSNPGAAELQSLEVDGVALYLRVADMVANRWSELGECGLVVGATAPAELGEVRARVGDLPLLVPGIGAQGGDLEASVAAGATADGTGLLLSSSRAVLWADPHDPGPAARAAAEATRDAIRDALPVG
ncbi:orotidine-5'-phosphate decarboxylase [Salsipaludibacter albus]|uniref:orotidine-5'-phosphate decarboxylase n=1 Tax=Salsipaludibacter albus TaxID=2849650 RepID=UPI00236838DB|nr:orotidine-5'-phosphate decarboxylase [Salsipaludibacter albus]MBY5163034.1 orotidine-5'-phosphate decarboxylase [Salsipaludibacter albus]